ncbi:unnamed protein product, partial [Polarella glacialis]
MAAQFSEGWSGTPMWQLAQEREENQKKEQERRKAQAGDVLEIGQEGEFFHSVLVVSRLVENNFRDTKVRGPRRKIRAEAVKDGLELRAACRGALEDSREEAVQKQRKALLARTWRPE